MRWSGEKHDDRIRDASRHLYVDTYWGVGSRLERVEPLDQLDANS